MVGRSSNGHSGVVRDVVYLRSFEFSAQRLGFDTRTLDVILEGLLFVIARLPEIFPARAENDEGQFLHAARYTGTPPLLVWYTFDAEAVQLWFLTAADPMTTRNFAVAYNPSRRTSSSAVIMAPVRPRASWAAR